MRSKGNSPRAIVAKASSTAAKLWPRVPRNMICFGDRLIEVEGDAGALARREQQRAALAHQLDREIDDFGPSTARIDNNISHAAIGQAGYRPDQIFAVGNDGVIGAELARATSGGLHRGPARIR